jgi:hypothetical protein
MRSLFALSLLAFALTAQAQLYRWTDENGKVHYTDLPPPANATNVQRKSSAGAGGAGARSAAQQSYALQQAVKNFPVVVYTSKNCGDPCKQGLDYLRKRGVPYTEKVVAKQGEIDKLSMLAGAARVPSMVVGVAIEKGFEEQSWSAALDTAGYPKAGVP